MLAEVLNRAAIEFLANRLGKLFSELDQQRVAAPGIGADEQRRLIDYLVRHASSLMSSLMSSEGERYDSEAPRRAL